jgi:hypothetical protein
VQAKGQINFPVGEIIEHKRVDGGRERITYLVRLKAGAENVICEFGPGAMRDATKAAQRTLKELMRLRDATKN